MTVTVDGFSGLASYFTHVRDRLLVGARQAVSLTVEDAYGKALDLSSGPISAALLRQMDHPYARRHGTPLRDPTVINRQTGAFYAGWERIATQVGVDAAGGVRNVSWVGPYLEQANGGPNSRMVPRQLTKAVIADVEPRFILRADRALVAAFLGR